MSVDLGAIFAPRLKEWNVNRGCYLTNVNGNRVLTAATY